MLFWENRSVVKISEISLVVLHRFVVIVLCSMLIGFNRGKMNQFAGLKTHLFVGIGAGLSFLIPFVFYANHSELIMDPFRLSAQVISGIGFLGAGTIIKSGQSIKGLTTAAGLWATAVIAIALASGLYIIGILATVIVLLFLMYGNKIDISRRYSTVSLIIKMQDMEHNLGYIDEFMKKNVVLNKEYVIVEHINDGGKTITMIKFEIIHRQTHMSSNEIIKELSKFDFITKIDLITELDRM